MIREMSESNLSIVDVGHGNCAVLFGNNETVIVDCGGRGASLLRFLDSRGISKIKAIFLSHSDEDHIGGLITLLGNGKFEIGHIYANSDGQKPSKLWDDLIFELDAENRRGRLIFELGIHTDLKPVTCGDIVLVPVGPTKYLAGKGVGNTDRAGRRITSNGLSASFSVSYK